MLHRDGPETEESSPSPLTPGGPPLEMGREVRATKGRPEGYERILSSGNRKVGNRRAPARDGHRTPEGRGGPSGRIGRGKHSRGLELECYVPNTRPIICTEPGDDPCVGVVSPLDEPAAGNLHGGVCEGGVPEAS